MSIKLENGKYYLVKSNVSDRQAVVKYKHNNGDDYLECYSRDLDKEVFEIISEMAPVKQEEPEYVKVESIFDVSSDEFMSGECLFWLNSSMYRPVSSESVLMNAIMESSLYRLVKVDKLVK